MNFSDYVNNLTYPKKDQFTTVYVYSAGQVVWKGPLLEFRTHPDVSKMSKLPIERVLDEAAFVEASTNYRAHGERLIQQFKLDMENEFGVNGHPKADAVYKLAYDYGHAAGLQDVYDYYGDLVTLIK